MTNQRLIVAVAVPTPLRRTFDYRWPSVFPTPLIGTRVRIPFGRRQLVGLVSAVKTDTQLPVGKLKDVQECLDEQAVFTPPLAKLLDWLADYYHHPIGEVFHLALPILLRRGQSIIPRHNYQYQLSPTGRSLDLSSLSRAPLQKKLLEKLRSQTDSMSPEMLTSVGGSWRQALKQLQRKALVECVNTEPLDKKESGHEAGPVLTDRQTQVVEAFACSLGSYVGFVLRGVTGSGKTEVYLRIASEVLSRGQQVIVLAPEIALTPQLIQRFQARLPCLVVVLHSNLNDTARHRAWWLARNGKAGVILGTRSAIFAPTKNLGAIVVDEEHDAAYKQQDGCRYHARDAAVKRASLENVPIILGSATPSLESIANVQRGRYQLLELPNRTGTATLPDIGLLDVSKLALQEGLTTPLMDAIRDRVAKKEQSLLFLNRRGYAPLVVCFRCGWRADCHRCDAKMTLHRKGHRLRCHHCGGDFSAPEICPVCKKQGNETKLYHAGTGTQRIEAVLNKIFPAVQIVRIDKDTVARKGQLEERLEQARVGKAEILIGTQMLSKGHDFPNVTLVGILNVDQSLFSLDFRATERLYQQVIQVAGRAGRAEKPGEVLIQTQYSGNPYFQLIRHYQFNEFVDQVLVERKAAGYPPFSHLALLRAESVKEQGAIKFLRHARAAAQNLQNSYTNGQIAIMDAVASPMERRAGRYRAQLLVKSQHRRCLRTFLRDWIQWVEGEPQSRNVRWSLDVDPLEMY